MLDSVSWMTNEWVANASVSQSYSAVTLISQWGLLNDEQDTALVDDYVDLGYQNVRRASTMIYLVCQSEGLQHDQQNQRRRTPDGRRQDPSIAR